MLSRGFQSDVAILTNVAIFGSRLFGRELRRKSTVIWTIKINILNILV